MNSTTWTPEKETLLLHPKARAILEETVTTLERWVEDYQEVQIPGEYFSGQEDGVRAVLDYLNELLNA